MTARVGERSWWVKEADLGTEAGPISGRGSQGWWVERRGKDISGEGNKEGSGAGGAGKGK